MMGVCKIIDFTGMKLRGVEGRLLPLKIEKLEHVFNLAWIFAKFLPSLQLNLLLGFDPRTISDLKNSFFFMKFLNSWPGTHKILDDP